MATRHLQKSPFPQQNCNLNAGQLLQNATAPFKANGLLGSLLLQSLLHLGLDIIGDGLGTSLHRSEQKLLFSSSKHFLVRQRFSLQRLDLTVVTPLQCLRVGAGGNTECFWKFNAIQCCHAEEGGPHRLINQDVFLGSRFGLVGGLLSLR